MRKTFKIVVLLLIIGISSCCDSSCVTTDGAFLVKNMTMLDDGTYKYLVTSEGVENTEGYYVDICSFNFISPIKYSVGDKVSFGKGITK